MQRREGAGKPRPISTAVSSNASEPSRDDTLVRTPVNTEGGRVEWHRGFSPQTASRLGASTSLDHITSEGFGLVGSPLASARWFGSGGGPKGEGEAEGYAVSPTSPATGRDVYPKRGGADDQGRRVRPSAIVTSFQAPHPSSGWGRNPPVSPNTVALRRQESINVAQNAPLQPGGGFATPGSVSCTSLPAAGNSRWGLPTIQHGGTRSMDFTSSTASLGLPGSSHWRDEVPGSRAARESPVSTRAARMSPAWPHGFEASAGPISALPISSPTSGNDRFFGNGDGSGGESAVARRFHAPAPHGAASPLRMALAAFCLLNALLGFLFAWMARNEHVSFALMGQKHTWKPSEKAMPIFFAGLYYLCAFFVLSVRPLWATASALFHVATTLMCCPLSSAARAGVWRGGMCLWRRCRTCCLLTRCERLCAALGVTSFSTQGQRSPLVGSASLRTGSGEDGVTRGARGGTGGDRSGGDGAPLAIKRRRVSPASVGLTGVDQSQSFRSPPPQPRGRAGRGGFRLPSITGFVAGLFDGAGGRRRAGQLDRAEVGIRLLDRREGDAEEVV